MAAACLSGSDATGCNERSRDAGIHRPAGLGGTEPLLGEVHGLTGIDGQAVYLNQISYNPSLALQCSGVNLLSFIFLKLSLKLIWISALANLDLYFEAMHPLPFIILTFFVLSNT